MDKLSIAPMLDITNRHCRYFFRLFSPHIRLYTEMVHCGAILFGDKSRFLSFDTSEHPIALQLGGSDPAQLALAAKIGEDYGFDEINLNVGCPSDRVQAGKFGACLMAEPEIVAECVSAMQNSVSVPVTVKNRIGIDDQNAHDVLWQFVELVSAAGCRQFIVHARKAWLKGLSPKDNRNIPSLDYALVHDLAKDFPKLEIAINGGINNLQDVKHHLQYVDSVMMGRAPIDNPWMLSEVSSIFNDEQGDDSGDISGNISGNISGDDSAPFQSRHEIVLAYVDYMENQRQQGVWLKHMVAPLMGLYKSQPNAKAWRQHLATKCRAADAEVGAVLAIADKMHL